MTTKRLCGANWRHEMKVTPGGWKACSRCGTLSRDGVPQEVRFWGYVEKGPKCWTWKGSCTPAGYGQIYFKGTMRRAHQVAYYLKYGSCPPWDTTGNRAGILHKCDNSLCVNPDHLYYGTQKQNMVDMTLRDRKAGAKIRSTDVLKLRARRARGERVSDLAREFGVKGPTMSKLLSGQSWKSVVGLFA